MPVFLTCKKQHCCYILYLEYFPKTHILNPWSLACGTNWDMVKSLRGEAELEDISHWGQALEGYLLS
jgi:hypothetical protein